jgi:uncharacterized protein with PIN domain
MAGIVGSQNPMSLDIKNEETCQLAREEREPVLWKGEDFGHTKLRAAL